MNFDTYGCFFDYYNYLIRCRGGFFVKTNRYQKDNVEKTFTFTHLKTFYTCFFHNTKLKNSVQMKLIAN